MKAKIKKLPLQSGDIIKTHSSIKKIKKFYGYNPKTSYKEGVKYLRKFFKTIHILEHDDIMNPNQYYDNALLYLKTSIFYCYIIFYF